MKNVAVILSGCGVFDGSEIYETVLTMYFLEKIGLKYKCFAPDEEQYDVVNHFSKENIPQEKRNILNESARLARGNITPLSKLDLDIIDGIIFPGGTGVIKSFCTFYLHGQKFNINSAIEKLIQESYLKKKIIAAMCIAPVLVAYALKNYKIELQMTVGESKEIGDLLKTFNVIPVIAKSNEAIVDKKNKVVTTPAYMNGNNILDISIGINNMVSAIVNF